MGVVRFSIGVRGLVQQVGLGEIRIVPLFVALFDAVEHAVPLVLIRLVLELRVVDVQVL